MDFNQIAHIFYPAVGVQEPVVEPQPIFNVSQPAVQQVVPEQPVTQPQTVPSEPAKQPQQEVVADPFPAVEQPSLNPAIPKSLQDLMIQNNVTETEIQEVVSKKGYYPADTPIANYDPGFIDGVLVAAWAQVYPLIEEARLELPF